MYGECLIFLATQTSYKLLSVFLAGMAQVSLRSSFEDPSCILGCWNGKIGASDTPLLEIKVGKMLSCSKGGLVKI